LPEIRVLFYADEKERAPVLEWLKELRGVNVRAYAKGPLREKPGEIHI